MPAIPDFPKDLLDQHHHWHAPDQHPDAGPGRLHPAGMPGGGLEFLTFHRNFMAQFHSWYDGHTFAAAPFDDPVQKVRLVAAWHRVPTELRKPEYGWGAFAADAARLDSLTPDFATADDLGTFIELGIHNNFLHGAASAEYGEPELATFHSPHISQFYGIHGLVNHWWARWQRRHVVDPGAKLHLSEVVREIDVKRLRDNVVVDVDRNPFKRLDDVKTAGFEVPDEILNRTDPVVFRAMADRLERLERQAFPGKAFLNGERRPQVGEIAEEPVESRR
jgi:hypothetical protein